MDELFPPKRLERLFARLNDFSKIALAVSGGADSVCLLHLFHRWRQHSGWRGSCEILTVDHGLRIESAAETRFVAALSHNLGYPHFCLRWSGDKPRANLQAAARTERYRLLADHMRQSGAKALVVAHHRDDQAETVLDRLTRGSGVYGLGGMADEETKGLSGLRILRPLLSVDAKALRDHLTGLGQGWCEDPSNHKLDYKRSRLRKLLPMLEAEGLSAERLLETARRMRRVRAALETVEHEFYREHAEFHAAGPVRLGFAVFCGLPEEIRLRALASLICYVTAHSYAPRLEQLERLDQAVLEGKSKHTLGGTVFERREEALFIWKEPGRKPPETIEIIRGEEGVWDERFRYRVDASTIEPAVRFTLGPIVSAPEGRKSFKLPKGWPRSAFDCAPCIWRGQEVMEHRGACELVPLEGTASVAPVDLQAVVLPPHLSGNQ